MGPDAGAALHRAVITLLTSPLTGARAPLSTVKSWARRSSNPVHAISVADRLGRIAPPIRPVARLFLAKLRHGHSPMAMRGLPFRNDFALDHLAGVRQERPHAINQLPLTGVLHGRLLSNRYRSQGRFLVTDGPAGSLDAQ